MKIIRSGTIILGQIDGVLSILLVQQTSGDYSIPKGRIKLHEGIREAALRETREETGICFPDIPKTAKYIKVTDVCCFIFRFMDPREASEVVVGFSDDREIIDTKWVALEDLHTIPGNRTIRFLANNVSKRNYIGRNLLRWAIELGKRTPE